jgi:outer membrane lipoprotein SlyB
MIEEVEIENRRQVAVAVVLGLVLGVVVGSALGGGLSGYFGDLPGGWWLP